MFGSYGSAIPVRIPAFLAIVGPMMIESVPATAQRITGGLKFGITQKTFADNLSAGDTIRERTAGISSGGLAELDLIERLAQSAKYSTSVSEQNSYIVL